MHYEITNTNPFPVHKTNPNHKTNLKTDPNLKKLTNPNPKRKEKMNDKMTSCQFDRWNQVFTPERLCVVQPAHENINF